MATRKYTNLHRALHQQAIDYYANLAATTERIQREETERAARLDREAAAARELSAGEREWLLANEHEAFCAPVADDEAGWGSECEAA